MRVKTTQSRTPTKMHWGVCCESRSNKTLLYSFQQRLRGLKSCCLFPQHRLPGGSVRSPLYDLEPHRISRGIDNARNDRACLSNHAVAPQNIAKLVDGITQAGSTTATIFVSDSPRGGGRCLLSAHLQRRVYRPLLRLDAVRHDGAQRVQQQVIPVRHHPLRHQHHERQDHARRVAVSMSTTINNNQQQNNARFFFF